MTKKEPVNERNLDGSGAPTIPWDRARERFGEDTGISPTHWLLLLSFFLLFGCSLICTDWDVVGGESR
jgi:hypothetical protein